MESLIEESVRLMGEGWLMKGRLPSPVENVAIERDCASVRAMVEGIIHAELTKSRQMQAKLGGDT